MIFIDSILINVASEKMLIVPIINSFYLFYKLSHIIIYIFITSAIFYLRNINYRFEEKINTYNYELLENIDKLKNTQQQLIQSEKMSAIGSLVSGIAHEINNPLNFISGALELIDEKKRTNNNKYPQNIDIQLDMIKTGYVRVNNIVKSLLSFSFTGSSKLRMSNINELISNTIKFYKPNIPEHIKILKDFKLDKEIYVYQDKLHQIILATIENAIFELLKLEDDEKKLKIETFEDYENSLAIIKITNYGSSIPEDILNRIFEPFYTTKDPDQGTGLGLSIAYNYIKDHSGSIDAINTKDGVELTIALPLKRNDSEV
jgi:C4-dicarboxylate-specific signal transduction histidine kinase